MVSTDAIINTNSTRRPKLLCLHVRWLQSNTAEGGEMGSKCCTPFSLCLVTAKWPRLPRTGVLLKDRMSRGSERRGQYKPLSRYAILIVKTEQIGMPERVLNFEKSDTFSRKKTTV